MAVQPPPERFRDVLDACAQGFGAPRFSDASAEREQTVWELDRAWVVEDDGRYVATATSYAFEMTVPGGARVPAAGVAQVAVLPTHRRQGRLRDVMGAVLAQAAELGEHYAILNASDSGIYGRFGFGQADRVLRIELDADHVELVVPTAPGRTRLVDAHEAAPLLAGLYDRFGRDRPGAVGRSAAWWDLVLHDEASWRGIGNPFVAVHEDETGEPDGYAVYRSNEHWDRGHANGTVEVRELEAASSAVEAALWRFLCDIDLRTRVVALPPAVRRPDPLAPESTPPGLGDRDPRPALGAAPGRRRLPGGPALCRRGHARPGHQRRDPPGPGRHLPGDRWPGRRVGRAGR